MKLNPSNKELYTDSGTFLKRLHCPVNAKWKDMRVNGANTRLCSVCDKTIHETAHLTDADLQKLISNDPQACLKINLNQKNVKIMY